MAHDSGLSDETLAGGTPDDIDHNHSVCELCCCRLPWADLLVEHDDETEETFVSCKDRDACLLRLNAEREELENGGIGPEDWKDIPY